jgi:1-deoxy-D-xylulose-5-phosphate synthase
LCIVSVGKMLDAAEIAAEQLEAQGISVTVWDARVVKPLDPAMIDDAARHPFVITVEDGLREGGVGMTVSDLVSERTIGATEPRVRVLGIPSQYIAHGKPDAILADLGLDAAGITASALAMIRSGNSTPAPS